MSVPARVRRRPDDPKPRPGGSAAVVPPAAAKRRPGARRRGRRGRTAVGTVALTLVASFALSGCYIFTNGQHFRIEHHASAGATVQRQSLVLAMRPTNQVFDLYHDICKRDFACFTDKMLTSKLVGADALWTQHIWRQMFLRFDTRLALLNALHARQGHCLVAYREFNQATAAWHLTWSWRNLAHFSCDVGAEAPPVG